MDSPPPFAFKKTLEQIGPETASGEWRLSPHVDVVSERRFLLCRLESPIVEHIEPSVFRFRNQAAAALAPKTCPRILEMSQCGDRLEILVPHCRLVDPDDPLLDADALLVRLVDCLAHFEEAGFTAGGVTLGAIASRGGDRLCLLPNAYLVPPVGGVVATQGRGRRRALRVVWNPPPDPRGGNADTIAALARQFDDTNVAHAKPLDRFRRIAAAVEAGDVRSARHIRRLLDGTPMPEFPAHPRDREGEADFASKLDRLETLASGHRVLCIGGGPRVGKTYWMRALARRLARRDDTVVRWLDEWDLGSADTVRALTPPSGSRREFWFFDDVEEIPFLHARLWRALTDSESGARHVCIVCSADPAAPRTTRTSFLGGLRLRVPESYATWTVDSPERPSARLAADGESQTPADGHDDPLSDDSRRILELLSVSGGALPHDIIESVFEDAPAATSAHRLVGRGLIDVQYRPLPPTGRVSVALVVASASRRHRIYDSLSPDRRRRLHRTLARYFQDRGGAATIVQFDHFRRGTDRPAAARCAAAFLTETRGESRQPFIDDLFEAFCNGGLAEGLPVPDNIEAAAEVASDLFAAGRLSEADEILAQARSSLGGLESESVFQYAGAIARLLSLLADVWSVMGRFSRALSLLNEAKDELVPALSLPDQAQYHNDIAWIHYRLGEYENAVEACKPALNTLNASEHPLVVAQALNIMGVIHFNTSRYDEAVSYYERSAFLREREGDINALAASYNNLALAHQTTGEYDKALRYYHKSLEIKRELNNEVGIAAGQLNLALLYLEVHNFDEAEKKCRESLDLSAKIGNTRLVAENFCTMGDIEMTRGQYDEAERHFRRSLDIARSLETINEEMGALRRLAALYLIREELDAAGDAIEEAARLGSQIGSRYESAQIDAIRGDLADQRGQTDETIRCYERAAGQYIAASRERLAAQALAKAGIAQADIGDSFEARRYLDRATDLINTEIGREIPTEVVTLQQKLRERPAQRGPVGADSEKLLYAFYELSSLTDAADDQSVFFQRVISVFQDLTGASRCVLALRAPVSEFTIVDRSGGQTPLEDVRLKALFEQSLKMGNIIDSVSNERVSETLGDASAGFICVPMRAMGRTLGCLYAEVSPDTLPLPKEDANFLATIGRHIAGDLRLALHLKEHTSKEETLEKEFETLRAQVANQYQYKNLIGKDESMRKVFRMVDKVRDMDTGLLIIGESGTGKTELARTIHYNSPRRNRVFQELHCAEIPVSLLESELFGHEKGAFTGATQRKLGRCEIADGGTVFLDDVNVIPIETQTRLLHYLESKSFLRLGGTQKISTDVRIIAASNEDLEALVKEGKFREDLFYRLKIVLIDLPPLRDRKEDVIAIAERFLKKRCQEQGKPLKTLPPETIKLFQRHRWPGNVRELQNVLEQVVLLSDGDVIEPSSLPEDFLKKTTGAGGHTAQGLEDLAVDIVRSGGYSESNPLMPQLEKLLAALMAEHTRNKSRAAHLLGITKPTLYSRLKGYEDLR